MHNMLHKHCLIPSLQLMPYFVAHVMGSSNGIVGLFLACLFSGTMSTVSSGLNSITAVIYQDFLQSSIVGWKPRSISLLTKAICNASKLSFKCVRLAGFFFGLVCTGLAFLGPYVGTVLNVSFHIHEYFIIK
jgi:hypothetical protein